MSQATILDQEFKVLSYNSITVQLIYFKINMLRQFCKNVD